MTKGDGRNGNTAAQIADIPHFSETTPGPTVMCKEVIICSPLREGFLTMPKVFSAEEIDQAVAATERVESAYYLWPEPTTFCTSASKRGSPRSGSHVG